MQQSEHCKFSWLVSWHRSNQVLANYALFVLIQLTQARSEVVVRTETCRMRIVDGKRLMMWIAPRTYLLGLAITEIVAE
jgi:hypothetical protein